MPQHLLVHVPSMLSVSLAMLSPCKTNHKYVLRLPLVNILNDIRYKLVHTVIMWIPNVDMRYDMPYYIWMEGWMNGRMDGEMSAPKCVVRSDNSVENITACTYGYEI